MVALLLRQIRPAPWGAGGRMILAFVLVALALGVNDGVGLRGLPLLLAGLAVVGADIFLRRGEGAAPAGIPPPIMAVLLTVEMLSALRRFPGRVFWHLEPAGWVFLAGILTTWALAVAGVLRRGLAGRRVALALAAVALATGVARLLHSPSPFIDAFVFQQQGAANLLSGRNPYQSEFPNIFSPPQSLEFLGYYAPQVTYYVYPPLSLLMTLPGYLIVGDVRLSMVAAEALTGLLLWTAALRAGHPPGAAVGLMGLLFLSPVRLHVLGLSWTEPLVGLVLVALVGALLSGHRSAGLVLGLLLAIKQYSIVALPLLISRRFVPSPRLWIGAALAAAAATLPFVLWDAEALLSDTVGELMRGPFRRDGMSVTAAVAHAWGREAPGWLSFVAAGLALAWMWKRLPSGPSALAAGLSLAYLCFFVFGKQAACNYYYYVGILLLASAAAAPSRAHGL